VVLVKRGIDEFEFAVFSTEKRVASAARETDAIVSELFSWNVEPIRITSGKAEHEELSTNQTVLVIFLELNRN
jgi:hypothetical protein